MANKNLKGKISGAVGAHNASEFFRIDQFEYLVLRKLNLKQAPISTQILPPEYLTDFLYSYLLLSATLGQFGRDCRNLMRSEIGEVTESFEAGQVGSSTMAHKRNPINFENLEGMYLRNRAEFLMVTDLLISEHQRDLTGSSLLRDLPIMVVNLQQQLDTINHEKNGESFIKRLVFDQNNLEKNFHLNAGVLMAEPLYIALQQYGYKGDAHALINNELVPAAKQNSVTLFQQLMQTADINIDLKNTIDQMPIDLLAGLEKPEEYLGDASEQAHHIAYKVWESISAYFKS